MDDVKDRSGDAIRVDGVPNVDVSFSAARAATLISGLKNSARFFGLADVLSLVVLIGFEAFRVIVNACLDPHFTGNISSCLV